MKAEYKNYRTDTLHAGWQFCESGTDKWLPAEVPETVHNDLLRHKLLPDPFYGTNEKLIQWVENRDWHYKTSFNISKEQLNYDAAEIFFEGLDTYAYVSGFRFTCKS